MDLQRWPHADALLDEALALPADARAAFVRARAGGDADLIAALDAVLAEATRDDGFLDPGATLGTLLAGASLQPGDRLEHYEVLALIGRGGMGEVYRARDTRLGRDVALKVLAGISATQPDRVARFRREAQVLASLSHPNIAAIHGVAEDEGLEALVLELVEGPTLAERIAGAPLPLAETLALAGQLVDAIEAAHERGVLHRDLKPANVKVTASGAIKVLDFGLAKVFAPLADAPPDLTAQHPDVRLGTAAYMSPEQIRGTGADRRSDIWAFGCVVYEMLTGRRAFGGATAAEVMARALEREPDWGALPHDTPPPVRRLLRRCLQKDPARRLGFIGDARLDLQEEAEVIPAGAVDARAARPLRSLRTLGIVLAAAGAGALLMWSALPVPAASPERRLAITLAAGESPVTGYQPSVAVSPDGRTVVYRARRDGVTQLVARRLDALEAVPIAGTTNATGPFFSPDGQWVGFDGDGVLKRVPLAGGAVVDIVAAPGGVTATWLSDDTIVFATNTSRVLQRVSASGGAVTPLSALDVARGETLHLLPQAVPGRRAVVFTIASGAARELAWLSLEAPTTRPTLWGEGSHARLVDDRRLVFARNGTLWRATYDASAGAVTGVPTPWLEGVDHTDAIVYHYDIARDGTMVYLPAGASEARQRLAWFDRDGRAADAGVEPGPYTRVALSPDGTRVAVAMNDRGNTDIWVGALAGGPMARLTADPAIDTAPIWSPDGGSIVYRSERPGPGLFRRDAQGAGPEERLSETDGPIHSPYGWTPDGRTVLLSLFRSFSRQAIAAVTPPDRNVQVLLDGEFAQVDPQVSPDGRWLAYQSDETGRFEVYVRPWPDVQSARWTVSTQGATTPRWSRDSRQLFMLEGTRLVTSMLAGGPSFRASAPVPLFEVETLGGRLGSDYEVAPDGRFLFVQSVPRPPAEARHLTVILPAGGWRDSWRD